MRSGGSVPVRTTEKQQHLPCAHTTPDAFLDKVKAKEPLVVLDVSTPAESGVYSVTLPKTLIIPSNELFTGNISVNVAR